MKKFVLVHLRGGHVEFPIWLAYGSSWHLSRASQQVKVEVLLRWQLVVEVKWSLEDTGNLQVDRLDSPRSVTCDT